MSEGVSVLEFLATVGITSWGLHFWWHLGWAYGMGKAGRWQENAFVVAFGMGKAGVGQETPGIWKGAYTGALVHSSI